MTVLIEVHALSSLDKKTIRQLKKTSFRDGGWMEGCVEQIVRGYAIEFTWDSETELVEENIKDISYSRAHALIARDEDGTFLGWALVRHPKRIVKVPKEVWDYDELAYVTKYEYGGRRADFMVYVKQKHRKNRVARHLLLVAYNNFGRMDAYPHDAKSSAFYRRNFKFVVQNYTRNWSNAKYKSREVF